MIQFSKALAQGYLRSKPKNSTDTNGQPYCTGYLSCVRSYRDKHDKEHVEDILISFIAHGGLSQAITFCNPGQALWIEGELINAVPNTPDGNLRMRVTNFKTDPEHFHSPRRHDFSAR